ncbi:hypothetical protein PM082_022531 [Marasmius tenuissimus]|nr:hypothetical protein PM082_022531 [Marasmius tenuissimus]
MQEAAINEEKRGIRQDGIRLYGYTTLLPSTLYLHEELHGFWWMGGDTWFILILNHGASWIESLVQQLSPPTAPLTFYQGSSMSSSLIHGGHGIAFHGFVNVLLESKVGNGIIR